MNDPLGAIRTRIAPTPSGYLHAGNAVNFLITHKLARALGGSILLRIDDMDLERTRPEYIQDIFDALAWLGITWDIGPRNAREFAERWSQTSRAPSAMRLAEALRGSGHLYACTCSRKLLDGCTCRDKRLPFDALDTCWRLRIPSPCPVLLHTWPSGQRGMDLHGTMRDPVLRQRNGAPAYQLASLADDVDQGINLIVRGEDLLPSSGCQMHIAALLGLEPFMKARFLHHPLVTDTHGVKLSKSEGASSLRAMRAADVPTTELHEQAERLLAVLVAQG